MYSEKFCCVAFGGFFNAAPALQPGEKTCAATRPVAAGKAGPAAGATRDAPRGKERAARPLRSAPPPPPAPLSLRSRGERRAGAALSCKGQKPAWKAGGGGDARRGGAAGAGAPLPAASARAGAPAAAHARQPLPARPVGARSRGRPAEPAAGRAQPGARRDGALPRHAPGNGRPTAAMAPPPPPPLSPARAGPRSPGRCRRP